MMNCDNPIQYFLKYVIEISRHVDLTMLENTEMEEGRRNRGPCKLIRRQYLSESVPWCGFTKTSLKLEHT